MPDQLELNAKQTVDHLTAWISARFAEAGFSKAVIGLSGGIDSSVSAALTALALSPENVWGVRMPYRTSSPGSLVDAQAVIDYTGIGDILEEITPQIDAYFKHHPDADPMRRGNKMARERMTILYDHSMRLSALVVGTGNKTEGLLGYTTMYGDNASALNPIGELYKAQVRQVGRELGLPEAVLTKPPSADLWAGQTDEEELGFTYEEVDPLLFAVFERGLSREEIVREGLSGELFDRVVSIHGRTEFKRRLPLVAPLD